MKDRSHDAKKMCERCCSILFSASMWHKDLIPFTCRWKMAKPGFQSMDKFSDMIIYFYEETK